MRTNLSNKVTASAFSVLLALSLGACGGSSDAESTTTTDDNAAETTEIVDEDAKEEVTDEGDVENAAIDYMTYDEYLAAAADDPVAIEAYVQATQAWWEDSITIYAADNDGAYFIYAASCSEEDAAKLTEGTKIQVSGYKSEWSGEVEIVDGEIQIVDDGDTLVTEPIDVTDLLGTDELIDYQNERVSFTGLTVAASEDADGNEVAYLYNYDGSGEVGDDLYFNVTDGTNTYSFAVESYLTDADSDVYKAVEGLAVGDTVDCEGFLYWYEGANPHITSVTVK